MWKSLLKAGNCYKSAFTWLIEQDMEFSRKGIRMDIPHKLVHADVIGTGGDVKGKKYGHAFVLLDNGWVLDTETGTPMPKDEYYKLGNVSNAKEYTFEEAGRLAYESGHYGPWD
tara:strand:- start:777 stop:1118 length:342 start_codon:yes stop_codon:yes gene_type:complete